MLVSCACAAAETGEIRWRDAVRRRVMVRHHTPLLDAGASPRWQMLVPQKEAPLERDLLEETWCVVSAWRRTKHKAAQAKNTAR
jgi:hypothetical protein